MARVWRAHHPGAAGSGTELALSRDEAHHVSRVLRLREGEPLAVFDGRGREWEGTLARVDRDTVRVRLGAERTSPVDPDLEVVLFQAVCRPERVEWLLEKGPEVGVAAVRLVRPARAEAPEPSPSRMARWRKVLLEACKQSGRRKVPELAGPDDLPLPPLPGVVALVLDPGAPASFAAALEGPRPPALWLAVGPEGGWTRGDVALLEGAGWGRASLGPRVLRTETAGVVATALALHAWGDLGPGPARGPG
jgi:16S rRNA (uracil1498-N3)-methyltransferase